MWRCLSELVVPGTYIVHDIKVDWDFCCDPKSIGIFDMVYVALRMFVRGVFHVALFLKSGCTWYL